MSEIADFPSLLFASSDLDQRFVLIQVAHQKLIFPAHTVAETLIIERSRLLSIPFYNPAFLGCFHHIGQIVPLFSMRQILGLPDNLTQDRLIVLRLSQQIDNCMGVGLVIDKILGTKTKEQFPADLLGAFQDAEANPEVRLFNAHMLPKSLFEPQR